MKIPPFIRLLLANLMFFMVLQNIGFAQDARQQERLMQLSERSAHEFTMKKAEALRLADSLRIPVRLEQADGRIMELMRFEMGQPVYYTTFNAGGASLINTDKVYPGGLAGFNLTGAGQRLGIWDSGRVRASHQEFTNTGASRVTQRDGASSLSNHATHVAGTLIAGGVDAAARGMSYEASLDAYDWNNDNAEMAAAAAAGLKVSQHSYGYITGWNYSEGDWYWHGDVNISETEDYFFGFYCDEARMWDEIAHNAPNYLIVKSAGNFRGRGPAPGTLHYVRIGGSWVASTATRDINGGADGYDCISRNGTAKNILSVGAIHEDRSMTSFSAWGPTDDGRIKPDLVAKGFGVRSSVAGSDSDYANYNGTSMAGPMVSGSVGLLLQYQEDLHPGNSLRAATIKALILHTADDMVSGAEGPDYRFGWGLMDTQKAASLMADNAAAGGIHIHEEIIVQDGQITIPVRAKGDEPLRATIVWTDMPGTPASPALNPTTRMLVNDLDLRVRDAPGNDHLPYVLDPANPANAASTGDNIRDNVEMVHIANPAADAIYEIRITHKGFLSGGMQHFSLVVSGNQPATGVANPQEFTATTDGDDAIILTWTQNTDQDDVMIAWSANNTFGIPESGTAYSPGQTIPGGGTVLSRGPGTSYNHTGLDASTTYYYRAFSYNEDNIYSIGRKAQATTDCHIYTALPFSENFDASEDLPLCWEIIDNQGNGQVWKIGVHDSGLTGTTGNYAYLDSDAYGQGNTQDSDLVTPLFDLSEYETVSLSFTHYFRQYLSSSRARLYYTVDDGDTWVQIGEWTSSTSNPSHYHEEITEVAGYAQVRFKWNYSGTWGYYWDVDDVQLTGIKQPQTHEIEATVTPESAGSVSGAGTYNHGDPVTLHATPSAGFQFVNWSEGESFSSADNPLEFIATADRSVTAHFSESEVPTTRALSNIVLEAGMNECFDALQTIVTGGLDGPFRIEPGAGATLVAGHSIMLLPGTSVEAGGYLLASISTTGTYCNGDIEELAETLESLEEETNASETEDQEETLDSSIAAHAYTSMGISQIIHSSEAVNHDDPYHLIRIYPNPTLGLFTIALINIELSHLRSSGDIDDPDRVRIEVFDMTGRRVISTEPSHEKEYKLDLTGQQPGMYVVRVVAGDHVEVRQLIKTGK